MAAPSQKKAAASHRRRSAAKVLIRVEVQAKRSDRGLLQALAKALRDGNADRAGAVRAAVDKVLQPAEAGSVADIFRSDLPDEAFEGVFDQPQQSGWRQGEL